MDIEDLGHLARKPKVTNYNACTVRDLKPGSIKEWCTCGLTKKGPWCDGKSHKGTTFKPLRWRVPDGKNTQTMYSICDCKYTTRPPYCDGIHYDLPLRYLKKIKECSKQPHDPAVTKLCEECGWAGPRESWPELPPTDSDSDDDDDASDVSDNTDDDKDTKEAKAKRLAANTPKVQIQLPGQHTEENATDSSETRQIACNGSCQAAAAADSGEIHRLADEIQRVQI
ncbi:hypothetical protein BGZ99_001815 [Dissophora globulifera]|uniref:Iron-binding zinc finger CDGSH type domain-containing protein n=1 Tax=Dissophora globulifera TaxID=979702 RepID=A0A9P6RP91_9FUNG|nr:hypothetical protein BGZ99_001815 [Dissophora globulifera]